MFCSNLSNLEKVTLVKKIMWKKSKKNHTDGHKKIWENRIKCQQIKNSQIFFLIFKKKSEKLEIVIFVLKKNVWTDTRKSSCQIFD